MSIENKTIIELPLLRLSEQDKQDIINGLAREMERLLKPAVIERMDKAALKEFFGCGETTLSTYLTDPTFPQGGGRGKIKNWDTNEVRQWWESAKRSGRPRK